MPASLSGSDVLEYHPNIPIAAPDQCRESRLRSRPMLDIAYIAIGAVFLGVCVLYALACDHL
jgi:hypothetical protein